MCFLSSEQHIKHSAIYVKSSPIFAAKLHEFVFMVDSFCDREGDRGVLPFVQTRLEVLRRDRPANIVRDASATSIEDAVVNKARDKWKHVVGKFRRQLSWWKVAVDR